MSTYGVTKYGAGVYGVAENTTTLIWSLQIAWDGAYNGDNEAMRMIDCSVRRGRSEWVGNDGFQPSDEGEAVCVVRNDDNRYWALDSSSPLYPYVRPGPYVRLSVVDGRGGTEYPVMRGFVDDIQCYTQGGSQFARIIIKDGLQWLDGGQTTSLPNYAGRYQGSLISYILADIGWPDDEWPMSSALLELGVIIPQTWQRNEDAGDAIQALVNAGPASLYQRRNGTMMLWSCNYTHTSTLTLTEDLLLTDVTLAQPWKSMKNRADVSIWEPVWKAVVTTLWTITDPVTLSNDSTIRLNTVLTYGDYGRVGPSTTFVWDWAVWTGAGGTGTNLTASCTAEYGDGAAWIAIKNASGLDGYITHCHVDSTVGFYVQATESAHTIVDNAASQAAYGVRSIAWDSKWVEDAATALTIADWLVTELSVLQVEPEVQIEARAVTQFSAELYETRVGLTLLDIADYFRIGHITHEWLSDNGQAVRTTFKLEPYLTAWTPPP